MFARACLINQTEHPYRRTPKSGKYSVVNVPPQARCPIGSMSR